MQKTADWMRLKACFAAGTPLLWEHGSKAIEEFRVGDRVWSRDEHRPDGALELRVVEEVFARVAPIWHLHVGGQVIATTAEHPFFAFEKGWTATQDLVLGDHLLTADGSWSRVDDLHDTQEWLPVFNLRIADFHTYFVGCEEWGFSVWAHNADYATHLPGDDANVQQQTTLPM